MKPGAILVNTSRGPVLDEQAVAEALRDGQARGGRAGRIRGGAPPAGKPAAGSGQRDLHRPRGLVQRGVGAWS